MRMRRLRRQNGRRLQMHGFGEGIEKAPKPPRKRIRHHRLQGQHFHLDTLLCLQRRSKMLRQGMQLAGLRIINQQNFFGGLRFHNAIPVKRPAILAKNRPSRGLAHASSFNRHKQTRLPEYFSAPITNKKQPTQSVGCLIGRRFRQPEWHKIMLRFAALPRPLRRPHAFRRQTAGDGCGGGLSRYRPESGGPQSHFLSSRADRLSCP